MQLFSVIEPFTRDQEVFLVSNDQKMISSIGRMPLTTLYSALPAYAQNNDIDKITFKGNVEYIDAMIRKPLEEELKTKYSNKNIEIEVVG